MLAWDAFVGEVRRAFHEEQLQPEVYMQEMQEDKVLMKVRCRPKQMESYIMQESRE
jgi:hypothetical protein